jgi:FkbM family methyltransferase
MPAVEPELRMSFERELISGLLRASHAFRRPVQDQWRFPATAGRRGRRWARALVLDLMYRCGFVRASRTGPARPAHLAYVLEHLEELAAFHDALEDGESRRLLVELLKYRILGPDHVCMPVPDGYWRARASIRKLRRQPRTRTTGAGDTLDRFEVAGAGAPIRLDAHPLDLLNVFLLEQYAFRSGEELVAARCGDILVDGGGCSGDTALYFAAAVGPAGQVHSFEFAPDNLEILRSNLALNPGLAPRVRVMPAALWSSSGSRLPYAGQGAATAVTPDVVPGADAAPTVALDDYVEDAGLPRVDFIKLDIEGAELAALQGAERALRRWRPRLAVAVYHRLSDFVEIPRYMRELDLGYRFFLGHFTTHSEETILFATAEPRP